MKMCDGSNLLYRLLPRFLFVSTISLHAHEILLGLASIQHRLALKNPDYSLSDSLRHSPRRPMIEKMSRMFQTVAWAPCLGSLLGLLACLPTNVDYTGTFMQDLVDDCGLFPDLILYVNLLLLREDTRLSTLVGRRMGLWTDLIS